MNNFIKNFYQYGPLWDVFHPKVTTIHDPKHVLNVHSYIDDGFAYVCRPEVYFDKAENLDEVKGPYWKYCDIDESMLFNTHTSWVYFVVVDNAIVKVGESGVRLGIPGEKDPTQPLCGTTNRFGRLRKQEGDTDQRIREKLIDPVMQGRVTLWAKPCPITTASTNVQNNVVNVDLTMHKYLETAMLDHIESQWGRFPVLNLCRK